MIRFFAFVSGAVLMSLEILGSRVLAPHYGNSIIVWGSLIGVFLGALSAGYWLGGILADRWPRLGGVAAVLAVSGVLVLLIPNMAATVFVLAGDSLRAGSLLSAIGLFFVPTMLMGAVSPYAIRLHRHDAGTLGRTAGGLYAVSTLGSIAGTIATAFWLVPLAGVSNLIRLLGGILLLLAVALLVAAIPRLRAGRMAVAVALGTVLVVGAAIGIAGWASARAAQSVVRGERLVLAEDTFYHHIRVTETDDALFLHFDHSDQSAIYKRTAPDGPYAYTQLLHIPMVFVPEARNVLFIGLGGGVVARQYLRDYPNLRIDAAEIDPDVIKIAQQYFGFPRSDPRVRLFAEDGRRFLEKSDRIYDLIIIDAFYKDSMPFHLVTKEFFALCRKKMAPGGLIAMNTIGTVSGRRSGLFTSIYQTAGEVFSEEYVFSPRLQWLPPETLRNSVLIIGMRTKMSDMQIADAFDAARRRGVRDDVLRHVADYLSRPPDIYLARVFSDDYAPVDDMLNVLQQ
ncbi:MAG TPA: fused MFS/spermidine synthase [Thermoanaerobaculia bacterium]|nr:fused MFS/spermidine synthase [Thermoanaerobaculia bacterium]